MKNSLFSIRKDDKHIHITFLGLKLSFKYFFNRKMYNAFCNKKIEPKTILIIEFNGCHYETIPGLCKYCTDLGYNVDILTREPAMKIFDNLPLKNVRVFECNPKTFDRIYNDFDFSKYERIIYNSKRIYKKENAPFLLYGYDISECRCPVQHGQKENICLQHHIDKINETPNDIQIILANPSHDKNLDKYVVNAHYFGDTKYKTKNKITNFITLNGLLKCRNLPLLIEAVRVLHNSGERNFKVTIMGQGEFSIPQDIKKYFDLYLWRIDFQKMFNLLRKADLILPLLDPMIKGHERYMSAGTSGTFQLVYGFDKPCIIHKTFADIYGFDNSNSIVYETNSQLPGAMKKAILMKDDEYTLLQNNLSQSVKNIEKLSRENIGGLLNGR